jgi:guanylate kinase
LAGQTGKANGGRELKKGKLFVISGCSGVGKSTVLKLLMAEHEELIFSVSATTRAPRPGEREGVDYTYVSRECFQGMIERDEFLEYDSHMSNFYGTPAKQLEEKMERGIAILDVEPKGAFQVRAKRPDATLIFVAPPSLEELERRLRSRGDTSEEQIRIRMERAAWEMEQSKKYDYIVVNDQVETCADKILQIIANVCGEE